MLTFDPQCCVPGSPPRRRTNVWLIPQGLQETEKGRLRKGARTSPGAWIREGEGC